MKKLLLFSLLCLAFVIGCSGPETTVTGTWKNDSVDKKFDNLRVVSLSLIESTDLTIEQQIAQALTKKGISTSTDVNLTSEDLNDNDTQKEDILQKIKNNDVDAILTISVIDSDTETRYVIGAEEYDPITTFGYYDTFTGYYNYRYPADPDYYTLEKTYFMEANIFDAETEKLVWSAQSEIYHPGDLEKFADAFAKEIADRLDEENIIE